MGRGHAAALTAAVVAAVAGCGPFGDGVDGSFEPLGEVVEDAARTDQAFRLSSVTDFDWDRVHAFPPYSSREEIVRQLGLEWDGAGDTASRENDSYNLLVFVRGGQVVRAFDDYVGDGNLTCIDPPVVRGGLSRSEAVLRVSEARNADGSSHHYVALARPRDAREARRTERCLKTYS